MKPAAIIVDFDSTLANIDHRLSLLDGLSEREVMLPNDFHAACGQDRLNQWCFEIIDKFSQSHKIFILTGRPEEYYLTSQKWLLDHRVSYSELYMRKEGNFTPDPEMKKEIYEQLIKHRYDISFVLEDRKSVVEMWRSQGLICLQCDWGEF